MFPNRFFAILLTFAILFIPLQAKKFEISPRIINGESSKPNQFPYIVSLRQFDETFHGGNYKHFCGAALIGDRWVISAAHCVYAPYLKASSIRIVVGAYDYWQDGDVYKVMEFIRHEKFSRSFKENDISLLQTEIGIIFSKSVQPIAISKHWIEPEQNAVLAGFGLTGTKLKKSLKKNLN